MDFPRLKNQTWPMFHMYQNTHKISNQLLKCFLRYLDGNENQIYLPGNHIGYPINSKIERDLRLICMNKSAKFQINRSNASGVIGQNKKSKMDTWRPFWISDQLWNQTWPVSYNDTTTYQKLFQYLKWFTIYQQILIIVIRNLEDIKTSIGVSKFKRPGSPK